MLPFFGTAAAPGRIRWLTTSVRDEVRNLTPGIPYRADAFLHRIQLAVLLSIHETAGKRIACANRLPNSLVNFKSLMARFQSSWALPAHLAAVVSARYLECRIPYLARQFRVPPSLIFLTKRRAGVPQSARCSNTDRFAMGNSNKVWIWTFSPVFRVPGLGVN